MLDRRSSATCLEAKRVPNELSTVAIVVDAVVEIWQDAS